MKAMTELQRSYVHPFRGDAATLPDDDTGRARLSAWWNEPPRFSTDPGRKVSWQRGVEHADAAIAERMCGAIEVLDDPSCPARDPEVEAVVMWILDQWSRRDLVMPDLQTGANDRYAPIDALLVRRWLAAGGIPFALQVLAAFPRYEADHSRASSARHAVAVKARDGLAWWCLENGHLGLIHALRKAIATSDDTAYAAGVAEAIRLRETAPRFLRAALAFAFPDEPFWEADLAACQPSSKKARLAPEAWALATTRVAEVHLPAILDSMARDGQSWVTETERYGFTLVHRLGDAAAPYLVGYLEAVRAKSAKEMFAEALALTDSSEARTFFQTKLKDKTLGAIAKRY